MSQSAQSIPPLNFDEADGYDQHEFDDDLGREMSLEFGTLGTGVSRFSEVTIEERKHRIANLVSEIYNTVPLNQGLAGSTRKSLTQTLKRYASVDAGMSDVTSVITNRSHYTKPDPIRDAPRGGANSNMRRFASSPKLMTSSLTSKKTSRSITVQNLGPLNAATSMINLKQKKNSLEEHVNKHMPLRQNNSVPAGAGRKSSLSRSSSMSTVRKISDQQQTGTGSRLLKKSDSMRKISGNSQKSTAATVEPRRNEPEVRRSLSPAVSRVSKASLASRASEDATLVEDDHEVHEPVQDEVDHDARSIRTETGSVARGPDIDYVKANKIGATTAGQHHRTEVIAATEAAEQKKKSDAMNPPEDYQPGSVPKYLQDRREQWRKEAERIERERPDPDCPPGHVLLPEEDRKIALKAMLAKYDKCLATVNNFPVRSDTLRARNQKVELENELRRLEEAIRTYERPKVFVKKNH